MLVALVEGTVVVWSRTVRNMPMKVLQGHLTRLDLQVKEACLSLSLSMILAAGYLICLHQDHGYRPYVMNYRLHLQPAVSLSFRSASPPSSYQHRTR